MRVDAYIVINLDSGVLAVTTAEPGAKTFDGQEFFFKDSIVSVSVPGVRLDPISLSLSSGSSGVKIITDLTPGELFTSFSRIAGSRARIWTEDEDGVTFSAFDGEVASVSFGLNEDTMEFSFESREDISLLEYPANNHFDNGRFVEKTSFNAVEDGGYTQLIEVLRPTMEFSTNLGTPSEPVNSAFVFQSLEIPLNNGTYNPGDLYLFFSDSASDAVVPVIYGTGKNVSCAPLGYYEVIGYTNQYYKIFIYPVASHSIIGDPDLSPSANASFKLRAKWNNVNLGSFNGFTVSDRLNGTVSYVAVTVRYADSNFEELYDPAFEGFNENEVYFETVVGKIGADGSAIRGLGNILFDMYQSSSTAPAEYIDWVTTRPSLDMLNKYDADIVINAKQEGQTLQSIFTSRLEGQFPVAIGTSRGKFAIQYTGMPIKGVPVRRFEYGVELIERTELQQTGLGDIENEVRIQYGANGASSDNSDNVLVNKSNSEIARASYDRWGKRPLVSVSVPDVQNRSTAAALADERLRRKGGIRMRVSYRVDDISLTRLPLMTQVAITDEDVGFDGTMFLFLGYEWDSDLTFISASFLSLDMI